MDSIQFCHSGERCVHLLQYYIYLWEVITALNVAMYKGSCLLTQVCKWKSGWNGSDLEAPPAAAVEVHLTQHVCNSTRVRVDLVVSWHAFKTIICLFGFLIADCVIEVCYTEDFISLTGKD